MKYKSRGETVLAVILVILVMAGAVAFLYSLSS